MFVLICFGGLFLFCFFFNTRNLQQRCPSILERILPPCKGQHKVKPGTNPACAVLCCAEGTGWTWSLCCCSECFDLLWFSVQLTKSFRFERTSRIIQSNLQPSPGCPEIISKGATSAWVSEPPHFPETLFQCFTAPLVKIFSLISSLNLPWHNLVSL